MTSLCNTCEGCTQASRRGTLMFCLAASCVPCPQPLSVSGFLGTHLLKSLPVNLSFHVREGKRKFLIVVLTGKSFKAAIAYSP